MLRDTFFLTLFFVLFAVAMTHILGNLFFLYWKFWWLDIVSHFLGGFWVGGSVLWIYTHFYPFKNNRGEWLQIILLSVVSGFAIGMMWEIFEVLIGSTVLPNENYFSDTIADLIFDSTGAFIAGVSFWRSSLGRYYKITLDDKL